MFLIPIITVIFIRKLESLFEPIVICIIYIKEFMFLGYFSFSFVLHLYLYCFCLCCLNTLMQNLLKSVIVLFDTLELETYLPYFMEVYIMCI